MKHTYAILFLLFAGTALAQQVQDQGQVIGSGQESQIAAALRQHTAMRGHEVQVVTSEKSAVQLWKGWQLGKFKKQYAVLVNYNPVLKKAHVTLGSKVAGDAQAWSALTTASFQQGQFLQGMQTVLGGLKARQPLAPQENHINDYAGVLDSQTRKNLSGRLSSLEKQLNLEGTVVVVPELNTYTSGTIEAFALNLFNQWGVGNPHKNDGFMLLVSMKDRKIRIQMGKGYSSSLNAETQTIIQNTIVPEFRRERYQTGIEQGMMQLVQLVKEHPVRPSTVSAAPPAPSTTILQQEEREVKGWELFLLRVQLFLDDLGIQNFGWLFLIPILLPLLFVVIVAVIVAGAIRSAARRGRRTGRGRPGFRHSSHPLPGHHNPWDDEEARRNAYMAGGAAVGAASTWDSSSSSSDSGSSSSDSFSGGSSDSSSGSSGDW